MATVLTEVHQAVSEGVANIKGWVEDLEQRLPKIAAMAERYENNPIIDALEGVVLGPENEQAIAALIARFAAVSAAVAAPASSTATDTTTAAAIAAQPTVTSTTTPAA